MERRYGYRSGEPGVRDFVIGLFKYCYAEAVSGDADGGSEGFEREAEVFFSSWKDNPPACGQLQEALRRMRGSARH